MAYIRNLGLLGRGRLVSVLVGLMLGFVSSVSADVVINEIMYHPYDTWTVTNETEFLEIHNSGGSAVDLSNYRFDNGVSFDFLPGTVIPAGGYLVICENLGAFTNAYPSVANVAGEYGGALNNGGERVTLSRLEGYNWVIEDTVRYRDPDPTDGQGYSLELVHPGFARLDDTYYGAWLASTAMSGTPGVVNSVYAANPAPVVGGTSQDPALPLPNSAVTITAEGAGYVDNSQLSLSLLYRVDALTQTVGFAEIPMYDNGLNGDLVADDGVFTVLAPEYGASPMTNGSLMEFRVKATDGRNGLSFTAPGTNDSGVVAGPYSYLCYFGEDDEFDGEYLTYHILMLASNKNVLETREVQTNTLLDATLATSDGHVYYNCGVRFRGGSSRDSNLGGYRVEFPPGRSHDGCEELNLNHSGALRQYIGMTVVANTGYGCYASDVKLCRVWVNSNFKNPGYGVYVRIEQTDRDFISKRYDDDTGNIYRSDGDSYQGGLEYWPDLTNYYSRYMISTGDPYTAWHSLSNLCWVLNQPVSQYPSMLESRVNWRQWSRFFAANVALDNREAGISSPYSVSGDELRIYCDPEDGQFDIYPWDFSDVMGGGGPIWEWASGASALTVRKLLFYRPIVPFYVSDVLDVITNDMSDENMNALFDEMGTAVDTARHGYLLTIQNQRAELLNRVNTNFSVRVTGAVAQGPLGIMVNSSSVQMTGTVSQAQTDKLLINGVQAAWDVYDTTNDIQNMYGKWTTNNFALTGAITKVEFETFDSYDRPLYSRTVNIIRQTSTDYRSGVISVNQSWNNAAGIIVVNGDVTVTSGATLTVEPDTVVLFQPNRKMTVSSGVLNIQGTQGHSSYMLPSDGTTNWMLDVVGGSSIVTGTYAEISGCALTVSGGAGLALSDSVVSGYVPTNGSAMIVVSNAASAVMRRCIVADYCSTRFESTQTIIEDCLFQNMSDCGLDLFTLPLGSRIVRSTVCSSTGSTAVDGISVSGLSDCLISNCLVYGISGSGIELTDAVGGLQNVEVSQNPAGWISLGTFTFDGDGTEFVRVRHDDEDARSTVADAMMFSNASEVVILDNTDPEFSSVGYWYTYSGRGEYGADYRTSVESGATAMWTPDPLVLSGTYDLRAHVVAPRGTLNDEQADYYILARGSISSPLVEISHSLVHGCGTGIMMDGGSFGINHHNTIAGCGVGYRGDLGSDSIVWDCDVSVTNGPVTISFCNVELAGTNIYAGLGNMNRTPWFSDSAEGDYRLQSISPCLNAASDGADIGAVFPVGACPEAPDNLVLTNVAATQMEVRWQDNSSDETMFEIERSTDGEDWSRAGTVAAGSTSYVNTGLVQNTLYYFRVRAVHDRGESPYSEERSMRTALATTSQLLAQNLRFSEIMYNALGDDIYEFLELHNTGGSPLNLSGLYFSAGIDYVFPNGTVLAGNGYYVIARDAVAFSNRYGAVVCNGVFQNATGLSNGGETLRIKDANGDTIIAVTYDDGQDTAWYPTTDGDGYSLVLVDPDGDPDSPASWRPSTGLNGSPGAADPASPWGIVINEVLSHTDYPLEDAIELYNAGTTTVDIAGWYLSDSANNLAKYKIAGSTLQIAPGQYHVFYEGNSFNSNTSSPSCFEISSHGESIYLSSSTVGGTNLTSFRTWVKFGAAENGVSFGRYVCSNGEVEFTAMAQRTFGVDNPVLVEQFRTGGGLTNSAPKVGPVVINEIMYNPYAGGKEFVEIYNTASSNIPLFDTAFPTNTWRFDGAFEFAFAPNTWIGSGEHVLVVSIEPQEFRDLFNITNQAIDIYGPFDGALANDGETVKLYKPDNPEPDSYVPYILVDKVKYDDDPPWPVEADNGGPSLERISTAEYGNDPTNWMAGGVGGTPGQLNNTSGLPAAGFMTLRASAVESNQTINVVLSLSPASVSTVIVDYVVGGTATPGSDYTLAAGSVIFWPYETTRTIPLMIKNDGSVEPDETVEITLVGVSASGRLGGNRTYTHTIVDNDATSLTAPTITPQGTNAFYVSTSVSMSSGVPDSSIYYTTDASMPTVSDNLYTGAVLLTQSARIKAVAFVGSANASAVSSALFLKLAAQPCTDEDADGDGMPDEWEIFYFQGTSNPLGAAGYDYDGDGLVNLSEYIAGTDPTNSASVLSLLTVERVGASLVFEWSSVTGRVYSVYRSDSLLSNWPVFPLTSSIPGDVSGTSSYTDSSGTTPAFYRIGVQNPD